MNSKKIAVAGIGYVGISNAILLSQNNEVVAVDVVKEKVDMINKRISPLVDKEVEDYLANKTLNLSATCDYKKAYSDADYVVVATPTNYIEKDNHFDTSYVEDVIEKVLSVNKDAIIVIKSTVPIGYTMSIMPKYPNGKFLFSPEFLREGKALYDNLYPSRIVVGVPKGLEHLYENAVEFAGLLKQGAKKEDVQTIIVNSTEAEAVKLFSNTYLAMRVAFFNELDNYCIINGLDAKQIIDSMCLEPRIGKWYNNPSFGYGGYCLPKDSKQMLANYSNVPNDIIKAIVNSNKTRKNFITDVILNKIDYENNKDAVVGIYRLTMKANSDNFRESAIQDIMNKLKEKNVNIIVYEPTVKTGSYNNFKIENDFNKFCEISTIIIANREDEKLFNVAEKVFTRDIYKEN